MKTKSSSKTFIVCDREGAPTVLTNYGDSKFDVLANSGRKVSSFTSREKARAAIKRTARYAERKRLKWDVVNWRVLEVVS